MTDVVETCHLAEGRHANAGTALVKKIGGFDHLPVFFTPAFPWCDLGVFLSRRRGQKEEAVAALKQALKIAPDMVQAYYGIACTHVLSQEDRSALESLDTALQKGFREFDHIENDSDWDGLRKNPKFTRLLRKYRDSGKAGKIPGDAL